MEMNKDSLKAFCKGYNKMVKIFKKGRKEKMFVGKRKIGNDLLLTIGTADTLRKLKYRRVW